MPIPMAYQGARGGTATFVGALRSQVYVDGEIGVQIFRSADEDKVTCRINLVGYLVPMPELLDLKHTARDRSSPSPNADSSPSSSTSGTQTITD